MGFPILLYLIVSLPQHGRAHPGGRRVEDLVASQSVDHLLFRRKTPLSVLEMCHRSESLLLRPILKRPQMSNEREILDPTPQCGDSNGGRTRPSSSFGLRRLDPIAYLSRIPTSFFRWGTEIGIETLSADFCSGHEERSSLAALNGREIALSGRENGGGQGGPPKSERSPRTDLAS